MWRVVKGANVWEIEDVNGKLIATCGTCSGAHAQTNLRNARLIAAAPRLLEIAGPLGQQALDGLSEPCASSAP